MDNVSLQLSKLYADKIGHYGKLSRFEVISIVSGLCKEAYIVEGYISILGGIHTEQHVWLQLANGSIIDPYMYISNVTDGEYTSIYKYTRDDLISVIDTKSLVMPSEMTEVWGDEYFVAKEYIRNWLTLKRGMTKIQRVKPDRFSATD